MSELVMGQEYLRIQIYFPKGEANLYRAMEALAKRDGVSMAAIARRAIRGYLDDPEVVGEVLGAASEAASMDHIRARAPCRHRAFLQDRTISCNVHADVCNVSACVECEEYEQR